MKVDDRVFVVSSMDHNGVIVAEGVVKRVESEWIDVARDDTRKVCVYNRAFAFLSNLRNRARFSQFVARSVARDQQQLGDMYSTLNAMER